MYPTAIVHFIFILTGFYQEVWSTGGLPVRLGGGSSPQQGRIEVYYDGEWGTVCDDRFTIDVCNILCKQLGYGLSSSCINELGNHGCQENDGNVFGTSTAKIWLDELKCDGNESNIDECQKSNWGVTNCGHKEDAGCICNQTTTFASDKVVGSCDQSRHRISPFDPSNPSLGRVEVQDNNRTWGLVCDDYWDDVDASVFCDCLGYKSRNSFRALLYPKHASSLPMLYNAVHCKQQDTTSTKNLWDCDVKADQGQCDPHMEAAGVICEPQPAWVSPVIPNVEMTCHGKSLLGCFKPESDVTENDLFPTPSCSNATISKSVDGTVCVRIDMSTCEPSHKKTNASMKHYCHDITFSKFANRSVQLLTQPVWTRRLCCIGTTNGTAMGSFLPQMIAPPSVYMKNSEVNKFNMTCYRGFLEDNETLDFPAAVQRGEPVSCFISFRTWDPHLYMIARDCKFMALLNNEGPQFYFLRNKCPTTDDLGLNFYNRDHHEWGFSFNVPKFQLYDELYLSCDIYLCDIQEGKTPYCDRSCSINHNVNQTLHRKKRMTGRKVLYSRKSMSTNHETGHIEHGPFLIEDDGFGPLINDQGQLVLVTVNRSGLARGHGNTNPLIQTGQAEQVVASFWIVTSISMFLIFHRLFLE